MTYAAVYFQPLKITFYIRPNTDISLYKHRYFKSKKLEPRYSSVLEYVLRILKFLGSIPSTKKTNTNIL